MRLFMFCVCMCVCVSASLCVVFSVDFGFGGQVNGEVRFSLCVCISEERFSLCSLFCMWACVYEVRFSLCVGV